MRWRASATLLLLVCACESTPVLLYHSVGDDFDAPRFVSVELFREQLQFLRDEGYTPITAAELDAIELDGKPRPSRPIVITFDDGYENFYQHAFPVLREFGFKATMFLVADKIGDDEASRFSDRSSYLIWPEIERMRDWGIDFQSHSVTHARLKNVPDEQAAPEIIDSKRILEERLGKPVTIFAYPFGSNDLAARNLVEEAGYRTAYSVAAGLNGRFQRLRISIHSTHDVDAFAEAIGGSWWAKSNGVR
jgi:peptidoglycan/xylan/chitin deacetylase (PgdA/CDA1 family)